MNHKALLKPSLNKPWRSDFPIRRATLSEAYYPHACLRLWGRTLPNIHTHTHAHTHRSRALYRLLTHFERKKKCTHIQPQCCCHFPAPRIRRDYILWSSMAIYIRREGWRIFVRLAVPAFFFQATSISEILSCHSHECEGERERGKWEKWKKKSLESPRRRRRKDLLGCRESDTWTFALIVFAPTWKWERNDIFIQRDNTCSSIFIRIGFPSCLSVCYDKKSCLYGAKTMTLVAWYTFWSFHRPIWLFVLAPILTDAGRPQLSSCKYAQIKSDRFYSYADSWGR